MIYISGKITDSDPEVQKKNLARFFEVEDRLENEMQGLNFCYNPARNEAKHPDWNYEQHLIEDLCVIWLQLPEMYFMKGWKESRGARLEMELAKRLGLHCEYE